MTDLFGRIVLLLTVVAMLAAAARTAFGESIAVTPEQAIARAVAERVGAGVSVEVTALETSVSAERSLHAMPEPGGRAGRPMRFVMMVGRARRGVAVATVKVLGSYARAARAVGRDEEIGQDAVEIVTGELPPMALKRLPEPAAVIGLTARRDIAPGEPFTQAVLDVPPLVSSGDKVVLTVVAGAVRVTAQAVASVSGHKGDVIRVVPQGGRPLKARITGPGAVEVVR